MLRASILPARAPSEKHAFAEKEVLEGKPHRARPSALRAYASSRVGMPAPASCFPSKYADVLLSKPRRVGYNKKGGDRRP